MNRRDFIHCAGIAGAMTLTAGRRLIAAGAVITRPQSEIGLSPELWSADERAHYLSLEAEFNGPHPEAIGTHGMLAGTSNPLAIHAGVAALKQGGTAADAALCTALTQVSLMFGAATNYAGVMNALYYQASTGTVYAMDACYNTVKDETDPMSIPPLGTPSGRSVLVPGFMAGVQALHGRFGQLPFDSLFEPAIWVAENGVAANAFLIKPLSSQRKFVTRLEAGKRIFDKPNGETYKEGDTFRQTILAETLKTIAKEGADYMYQGAWAHDFVDAAQAEGGKLTLKDLADYRVNWMQPLELSYGHYRLVSLAPPNFGGATTLIAMNLVAAADLRQFGHYTASADALYWFIQITRIATMLASRPAGSFRTQFPEIDLSPTSLMMPETAKKIWQRMQQSDWRQVMDNLRDGKPAPSHSAGVVAVDTDGNMASLVHSINSIGWGSTGIFIGGVSVPDSACIQQGLVAKAGPGKPLPGPANPVIALDQGRPVLGCSAIGSGLHPVTIQNLTNVLEFSMSPKQAADTPNFMGPYFGIQLDGPAKPEMEKETLGEGDFTDKIIADVEALGQQIKSVPKLQNRAQLGYWIGISSDPTTKLLKGGVTPELSARVEGY
jgi:gamma-glutamyltranspeptidase/glutathione hydrolase